MRIDELTENLARKELYLQQREKKWVDIENLLVPIYTDHPDLKELMVDLKVHTQGPLRIENAITTNERLKKKLQRKEKELKRLRKILMNPI
jgi:pyruvate-formate lyase-activating enzyme